MTNLDLITDALRELNVIDENEAPSAEQGVLGLRRLNQLMAEWGETDMAFPSWFEQSEQSADTPIPAWAMMAVAAVLAIILASAYGIAVSQELASKADSGSKMILRRNMNRKLRPIDLSNLPLGEAHHLDYNCRTS